MDELKDKLVTLEDIKTLLCPAQHTYDLSGHVVTATSDGKYVYLQKEILMSQLLTKVDVADYSDTIVIRLNGGPQTSYQVTNVTATKSNDVIRISFYGDFSGIKNQFGYLVQNTPTVTVNFTY